MTYTGRAKSKQRKLERDRETAEFRRLGEGLINQALQGLSVNSSAEEIAAHVSRALPKDIEMFGLDPQAIGVVVRRALA